MTISLLSLFLVSLADINSSESLSIILLFQMWRIGWTERSGMEPGCSSFFLDT